MEDDELDGSQQMAVAPPPKPQEIPDMGQSSLEPPIGLARTLADTSLGANFDKAPPVIEPPNRLARMLVAGATGHDILGRNYHIAQHEAIKAFQEQQRLNAQIEEHRQEQEQQNFWKQTEFAKYMLTREESLGHDYDAATQTYFKAMDDWSRANTEVEGFRTAKIPSPGKEKEAAIKFEALQAAIRQLQRIQDDRDATHKMLPAMIANFSPPSMVGRQGAKQGKGAAAQPPAPSKTPSEIARPPPTGPGIGDYPSGGMSQESPLETAPQQEPAPQTPVQYWGEMLNGLGFPQPQGGGDGTSLNYVTDNEQQAELLRERLKLISKTQFDIPVPATVVSRQALAQDAITKDTALAGQSRSIGNRIAFYKALTKSSDMVAMIRAIANDPNSQMGNEEGGNFATVLDANEKDRINIINGIVRDLEDQQRPIEARRAQLAGAWDVYMKSTLAPILEPTASSNVGTAAPRLAQKDFFKKYAADHGITPPISDSQHKELMDAWNAYNAH